MEIKSFAKTDGNREKVILLLTGTFNPPTIMHLRIFGKYERLFYFFNLLYSKYS